MPTISSRVDVTNNFPVISREVSALAKRAVHAAALEGAAHASQIASARSESGAMAGMRVSSPTGGTSGWEAAFLAPVYYAWFQNWGTRGNRTRPLKQPGRSVLSREPGTGITPLYFLDQGRTHGRKVMLAMIRAGL